MTELARPGALTALRGQLAGEALARVFSFSGWAGSCRPKEGGGEAALSVTTDKGTERLKVGPARLLRRGAPLDGPAPDWPREVSWDAARFFLTSRPLDTPVALDLDLAARRDLGDPYYSAVYTLKRVRVLLSRPAPEEFAAADLARPLALAVARFPSAVRQAAERRDPYPVNRCAAGLAAELRRFIRGVPLAGEDRRLALAAEVALGNALGLLGCVPFS